MRGARTFMPLTHQDLSRARKDRRFASRFSIAGIPHWHSCTGIFAVLLKEFR
jgi:hypothetical protein